jgi:competence protein ComEC
MVGDRFEVTGPFRPGVTRIRRSLVSGRVTTTGHERVEAHPAIHLRLANALRDRVRSVIGPEKSDSRGLLLGFLIGDTSDLSDISADRMRRAGLTHYVAVSGSNVALFLMLWWLLLGPLGLRRWWRTAAGLFGLAVFAAMTRWEPSVIRAASAAGVLLVARSMGVPLSAWGTLGLAVAGGLVLAGELATDVGFQLSVLAAIGVMAGSSLWRFRPTMISSALSASVAAQVMVSPVLVSTFGTVPILSPVANLAAGPLVLLATAVSGIAVLTGSELLVSVASGLARVVLSIAEVAAPWPQVGALQLAALVAGAVVLAVIAKPLAIPTIALVVAVMVSPALRSGVDLPAAVFLDVGQGDATLFIDDGLTVLIDGGPDPVVLARKLESYGIDHLDVLVVSHVHADHIVGLEAVVGQMPIGLLVANFDHHTTPAARWLEDQAAVLDIRMVTPIPGWNFGSEKLRFEVLGPLRRYASPNDESVVMLVTIGDERILMSGDMETYAQGDLEVPDVGVLKVPHQGAATSSLEWLSRHAGEVSVVSVGPNQFGHPSSEVLDVLESAGATVHRTDLGGDLVWTGR